MPWNKDPDKSFPARHPREPGGLRQDILDEIADHLACAAEREQERQENENEEAVWSRVLERFGDPDAIARTLWWDQMRETVMREWIQTGVMIVVTIAVLAGLAMMTRLVAGVGTANDAMRVAMEQVAASNENLAKAMAEQRAGNEAMLKALSGIQGGGGEKPDALELSSIEIVVRRGTPEGPPAPEVKVHMEGQGPGENPLSVEGELDASGRAVFERLYQGKYTFSFEDSKSGLSGSAGITLFAGKGAGEHVFVAPDVEPRPVQIEMDLPAYGEDSKQLIWAKLESSWQSEDILWSNKAQVVVGHAGTFRAPEGILTASRNANESEPWDGDFASLGECRLAGDIRVRDARLINSSDSGEWSDVRGGWGLELLPISEDLTGVWYSADKSDDIVNEYARIARLFQNVENVPGEDERSWMESAAASIKESVVIRMGKLPEVRLGEIHDGAVYETSNESGYANYITTEYSGNSESVLAMALPARQDLEISADGSAFLAVSVERITKGRIISGVYEGLNEQDGNVLSAYWLKSDWRSREWTPFQADVAGGTPLVVDDSPFWQIPSEQIEKELNGGILGVPLGREFSAEDVESPTGVLLRWETASEEFNWTLVIGEVGRSRTTRPVSRAEIPSISPDCKIRWMVTEPIAAAAEQPDGKALTDIDDGRFHYDSEAIPEPLTPQEPNLQPAP